MKCPKCGGPAVRLVQTGELSCVAQCAEKLPNMARRIALEERTGATARALGETMPPGVGFVLVLFDYGPGGTGGMAYASTGDREDMKAMLRELLDKVLAESRTQAPGNS